MANYYKNTEPTIYDLIKNLDVQKPLPIYFIFGEDEYGIDETISFLEKKFSEIITSDFDKQIFQGDKNLSIKQVLDSASMFPFSGEKKLIIVKDFNLIKDRKEFDNYASNPEEFTILIASEKSEKLSSKTPPYQNLIKNKYVFKANNLKDYEWTKWIQARAKEKSFTISDENAFLLKDIVGDNKKIIIQQIIKFENFLTDSKEITKDAILQLVANTKDYTNFDFQDAIVAGDKQKVLKIGYKFLENGVSILEILSMVTKIITVLTESLEFRNKRMSEDAIAAELGLNQYYFKKIYRAKFLLNDQRLSQAANALLNADLAVKTEGTDSKTIFTMLISELFNFEK